MTTFLDLNGIKNLINRFKIWIINNVGTWWLQFKMSRTDWEKTTWGYTSGTVDNPESDFKKDPKLWLRTNDWMFSKWKETTFDGEFPIPCAPALEMKDGEKYKSYYTDKIKVNPGLSTLTLNGSLIANGFVNTMFQDSLRMLMADGSTKELIDLPNPTIASIAGFSERDFYNGDTFDENKVIAYEVETGIEALNGSGSDTDVMFFQASDSGTVFRRINRLEGDVSGRFWGKTNDGDLFAWVADNFLVFSYGTPSSSFQGTSGVTDYMTNNITITTNG